MRLQKLRMTDPIENLPIQWDIDNHLSWATSDTEKSYLFAQYLEFSNQSQIPLMLFDYIFFTKFGKR